MMTIKFRAWDGQDKIVRDVKHILFNKHNEIDLMIDNEWFATGPDLVLMQRTGLKDDETGANVYQGDIAKLYWSDAVGEPHLEKVIIKSPFEYNAEEAMYFVHADRLEVIGNIYENPELLNG